MFGVASVSLPFVGDLVLRTKLWDPNHGVR